MKRLDLVGKKFGRLTVLSINCISKGYVYWNCICDCGNNYIAKGTALKSGNTKSCGCLYEENLSNLKILNKKPEKTAEQKRLHTVFINMRNKCYKKDYSSYHLFGGHGIKMHDEWKKAFINFYNWSIENKYSSEKNLLRKNIEGNFEPSNCIWGTEEDKRKQDILIHKNYRNGDLINDYETDHLNIIRQKQDIMKKRKSIEHMKEFQKLSYPEKKAIRKQNLEKMKNDFFKMFNSEK